MVDELPDMPEPLRASAFRAPNGEWAWSRGVAVAVTIWLAENGRAVLGGETWLDRGDGRVHVPYFWGWEVSSRRPDEGWDDYCLRAASVAREALTAAVAIEEETLPRQLRNGVRYNLTFCSEERYRLVQTPLDPPPRASDIGH